MARCIMCGEGVAYGPGQCVKPDGRDIRVVNHNAGQGIVIEAADIGDFQNAVIIANEERLK